VAAHLRDFERGHDADAVVAHALPIYIGAAVVAALAAVSAPRFPVATFIATYAATATLVFCAAIAAALRAQHRLAWANCPAKTMGVMCRVASLGMCASTHARHDLPLRGNTQREAALAQAIQVGIMNPGYEADHVAAETAESFNVHMATGLRVASERPFVHVLAAGCALAFARPK
jgi:hypothetical protein